MFVETFSSFILLPPVREGAYGAAIDRHDAVMRFNVLSIGGKHVKMVGKKTDYRVLNHIRSLQGCCKVLQGKRQPNKLPEKSQTKKRGGDQLKLILWHPGQQRKIMADCRRSNPGARVFALASSFIQKQVRVIKAIRNDLMMLGFGPFTSWKQLTSGAHGIFMMAWFTLRSEINRPTVAERRVLSKQ